MEKYALVLEEPALSLQAASVSREGSVGTDDAVARDDDGDWIGAVGYAHGANGFWAIELRGELAIADGAADADAAQGCPNCPLEWRSAGFDRESVDRGEFSLEVGLQCAAGIRWCTSFDQGDAIGARDRRNRSW
jgi:hypothetical protein